MIFSVAWSFWLLKNSCFELSGDENTVLFQLKSCRKVIFTDYWQFFVFEPFGVRKYCLYLGEKVDRKMIFTRSFWAFHNFENLFFCEALKLRLVMHLISFSSKEVWSDLWSNPRTLFSWAYLLAWFEGMEIFETLHYNKGEDVVPILFAGIVAVLHVACKYLCSPLPNSQSRQYTLLCSLDK